LRRHQDSRHALLDSIGGSSGSGPEVADMPSGAGADGAGAAVSVGAAAAAVSVVFATFVEVCVGSGVGSGALAAVVSIGAGSVTGALVAAIRKVSQDCSGVQNFCLKHGTRHGGTGVTLTRWMKWYIVFQETKS
jgi:hypothetical protein